MQCIFFWISFNLQLWPQHICGTFLNIGKQILHNLCSVLYICMSATYNCMCDGMCEIVLVLVCTYQLKFYL